MARNIYCHKCKAFLGKIYDAHLKKGIRYICGMCSCEPKESKGDETVDYLKGIFGMKD